MLNSTCFRKPAFQVAISVSRTLEVSERKRSSIILVQFLKGMVTQLGDNGDEYWKFPFQ
jgi:hypothetical protein